MQTEFEACTDHHGSNNKQRNHKLTGLPNANIIFECKINNSDGDITNARLIYQQVAVTLYSNGNW